ncbi:MAG: hypothetical protein FIA82_07635 [Melioribacter sp.]|nr:hypothetical protein [Melioribacter sp.]
MVSQFKTVSIFVFFILIFYNQSTHSQQLALPNSVITEIGTHKIYVKDFTDRYSEYLFTSGTKDNIVTRRSILNNMINEYLLYNVDDNQKIFSNPEYQKELNWDKKQTILAYLKDQEIFAKLTATDKEVRDAYYKSNEKISVRHLFATTEEEANNLYKLLENGSDFKILAKQVFTDTTLQNNGGYLGYFSWGDMDPAFEDAAYALNIGEISKPIKTKFGYSIIKLEDRKPHPLLTETEFLKKKKHMEKVVRMRKKRAAEIEYLNKLFDPNKVWFDEKILGNIFNNLSYSTQYSAENSKTQTSSAVCVKYENKFYKQTELEKRIDLIPVFHREKLSSLEGLKTVIKGIILQDILYQIALRKGYDKQPEVNTTISKYYNNTFLKYKRKEIADKTAFPDSVTYKFYTDNSQYFKSSDEMNIQEIILKRKTLADSLFVQLNNGMDFGSLAKKYSIRDWSSQNNGEMGFAEVSKYGMLKDTLWKSETGKLIGPIQIEGYYGIFKILGKRTGEIKKYEQVKNDVVRLLNKEKSKSVMQEYIDKLKSKVQIKVNEDLLGSIVINN